MDQIYEPQEDSFLLQKYVQKYAKGICLDMGTGSGIQAIAAAKSRKVVKVYALDINEEAINHCKRRKSRKIVCLKSNLFQVFRGDKKYQGLKFDTMIFNPPYLPDDPKDPDIALDGGKKGYELITRFITQAEHYIKPTTIILLIFSNFTSKHNIDNYLIKKRFAFKELEKIHIFFEDIYCYLIKKR